MSHTPPSGIGNMDVKYDQIGVNYNVTRRADYNLTKSLYRHLDASENGTYLDIGCGTGNYTIALQQKGLSFVGIDPSERMLNEARQKSDQITWQKGRAMNTGLESESIDGIVACLTVHHWDELVAGFQELHRVLKPEGKIVIFTSTPRQMASYWLNHYFPSMMKKAICQMPSLEELRHAMNLVGLSVADVETYEVKTDLEDLFLYSGKHKPELYFNDQVRQGISSFATLANEEEVKAGLKEMRRNMDRGELGGITRSYLHDMGDYLFVVGQKVNHRQN